MGKISPIKSSSTNIQTPIKFDQPNSSNEPLPPIRLIDFEVFKSLKSFPRYPDTKEVVELDHIDREISFIVFISHCWLRGWEGAEGYDKKPHPDNKTHDKFKLCRRGISMAWNQLAPGMKKCYVWLGNIFYLLNLIYLLQLSDFGCMDQDSDPAGELKQLDKIVEACDCLFTPLYHEDLDWELSPVFEDIYKEYKSAAWIGEKYGYLSRGWCRVEM